MKTILAIIEFILRLFTSPKRTVDDEIKLDEHKQKQARKKKLQELKDERTQLRIKAKAAKNKHRKSHDIHDYVLYRGVCEQLRANRDAIRAHYADHS